MFACRRLKAQAQDSRQGLQDAVDKTKHWRRSTEEHQALLEQSAGHSSQLQVLNPTVVSIFACVLILLVSVDIIVTAQFIIGQLLFPGMQTHDDGASYLLLMYACMPCVVNALNMLL